MVGVLDHVLKRVQNYCPAGNSTIVLSTVRHFSVRKSFYLQAIFNRDAKFTCRWRHWWRV